MSNDAWWVGAVGVLTTLIGTITPFILQHRKNKNADALAAQKQNHDLGQDDVKFATGILKEVLGEMRSEVARLNEQLDKQDEDHAACRAENAVLKAKVAALEARLEVLEKSKVSQ